MGLLSADIQNSENGGAEHDVDKQLKHEIEAHEEYDHVRKSRQSFGSSTALYGVEEEESAAKQKDACVDDRTHDRADYDR